MRRTCQLVSDNGQAIGSQSLQSKQRTKAYSTHFLCILDAAGPRLHATGL